MAGKKKKCCYVVKTSKYRVWNWSGYIKTCVWSAKWAVEVHGQSFAPSQKTSSLHTTNSELQKGRASFGFSISCFSLRKIINRAAMLLFCFKTHYGAKFTAAGYQYHISVSSPVGGGCLSASVWPCEVTTAVLQILVQATLALISHRLHTLPPFELVVITQVISHC